MCSTKKSFLLFLVLISTGLLVPCLHSSANSISYQGRLRESGQPVSGIRTFNFKLFNAVSAGDQIWTSGDISVQVSSGIYSTQIGNDSLKNLDFADNDYWLEISVGGNAFTPREKISAVPYAFNASTATNIMGAGNIRMSGASGNHWIANGNVGIGATAPVYKLHIYGGGTGGPVLRVGDTGGPHIQISDEDDYASSIGVDPVNHYLWFGSVSTSDLLVRGSRVGIGITNPGASLHVSSTTSANLLVVSSGTQSGQEIMTVTKTGKVGIGITNPIFTLDISSGTTNIVSSGSNANGSWVKYSDGTMICWFDSPTVYAQTAAGTNCFYNLAGPFTFPATFAAVPVITSTLKNSGTFPFLSYQRDLSVTGFSQWIFNMVQNGTCTLSYVAIGRWK